MDFVKLGSLPKTLPGQLRADPGAAFKCYKKRFEHNLSGSISQFTVDSSESNERVLVASSTRVLLLSLGDSGFSEIQQFARHKTPVSALAWRSDGRLIASGDEGGLVLVSSPSLGVLRRLQAHEGPVTALIFGKCTIFTAGRDGLIKCWDAATGQQSAVSLQGHTDTVTKLVLLEEGSNTSSPLLVSGSLDGTLRVWNPETGKCMRIITHDAQVDSFAVFNTGLLAVIFGGTSAKLVALAVDDSEMMTVINSSGLCHTRAVTGSAVFTDGDVFITTSADGTAKIRSSRDLSVLLTWTDFEDGLVGVEVSRKSGKIFLADSSGRIIVRDCGPRRVEDAQPQDGSEKIHIVGKQSKHESHVDFLLRKFEYKKVAQMVVASDSGLTILAALAAVDELLQRDALVKAVQGLSVDQMTATLDWATRSLTAHPEHTGLIIEFVDQVLNQNAQVAKSASLLCSLEKLKNRTFQEIATLNKIAPLVGTLQTLMLV